MIDLAFVVRSLPPAKHPFWQALSRSGLVPATAAPPTESQLAGAGVAMVVLPMPRASRDEIDRDVAREGARAALAARVDALERDVRNRKLRLVAFHGNSLYAAALGPRAEDALFDGARDDADPEADSPGAIARPDRSLLTFAARVQFGGAISVAVPAASRATPVTTILARFRDLAALRAELAAKDR